MVKLNKDKKLLLVFYLKLMIQILLMKIDF